MEQRAVLVTGSSSGIGAAVARRMTAAGMRVAVNSARSADAGRQLAEALPGAIYVQGDIADENDARRIVETTVAEFGRLDVLVNNAGVTERIAHDDLEAATPEIWRRIFDVNVIGTWQMITAALPHLRASGSGSIVNVSSVAGVRQTGSSVPYAASKAALNHMTRLLAAALGPGVRVNAVAPGLIETPWTTGWADGFAQATEWVKQSAPQQRVGTPEEIAETILFLADAPYTTGEVLLADGGLNLRI